MDDLELKNLEGTIEQLLKALVALKEENSVLQQRHESLLLERTDLIDKTEVARVRVEAMIGRLKTLEEE